MAKVVAQNLITLGSNVDATSYNTAALQAPRDTLILMWVASTVGSGTPNVPTVTGGGLTWVEVVNRLEGTRRLTLFRALGSSPTSGALTIDFAGQTQTQAMWSIVAFHHASRAGTNGSDAIVQTAVNSSSGATSGTMTLSALADAANATAGGHYHAANEATTEGSGFTQIGNRNQGSPAVALNTEFDENGDVTVDASWATNVAWLGIAVEIKYDNLLMEEITDNFNDNSMDLGQWDDWGGANTAEANQRLELTGDTVNGNYYGVDTRRIGDLTGSSWFAELVNPGANHANRVVATGVICITAGEVSDLVTDGNNQLYWEYNNGVLKCWKAVGGTYTQVGTDLTYNSSNHKFLRVRESGGTIYFDYSADPNSGWTNYASTTAAITIERMKGYLQLGNEGVPASASFAYWDNVNTAPAAAGGNTGAFLQFM